MASAATWRGVVAYYNTLPAPIKRYFEHLPKLAAEFPWDVALTYEFARVELAHNMTLYCGAVKLYRAHPELAWRAVQGLHITRDSFRTLFATVVGQDLDPAVRAHLEPAEIVRDQIMHGKQVGEAKKREAVVAVLDYANAYNTFVNAQAGIRPFGDLRGFKGRAKSLDRGVSRFLLKGMGLSLA